MGSIKNISGQQFNKWTVLNNFKRVKGKIKWECVCECGTIRYVNSCSLKRGISKSCGCLGEGKRPRTKHGKWGSPEYTAWREILRRCFNKKDKHYKNYGGRGITVCDKWKNSFEKFYEDMGDRPSKEYTIDRIENNKGYCKENCKWSTWHEQSLNRRRTSNKKYIGVFKKGKRFVARITHRRKLYYLGTYDTELGAAKAYDDKCEKLHNSRPNQDMDNY